MDEDNGSKVVWFLAGAALGATIALLFAPASGHVTRRRISKVAVRGREALADAGQDLVDKGKELYEKGRKMADEAAEFVERGRKLVEG